MVSENFLSVVLILCGSRIKALDNPSVCSLASSSKEHRGDDRSPSKTLKTEKKSPVCINCEAELAVCDTTVGQDAHMRLI